MSSIFFSSPRLYLYAQAVHLVICLQGIHFLYSTNRSFSYCKLPTAMVPFSVSLAFSTPKAQTPKHHLFKALVYGCGSCLGHMCLLHFLVCLFVCLFPCAMERGGYVLSGLLRCVIERRWGRWRVKGKWGLSDVGDGGVMVDCVRDGLGVGVW